MDSFFDLINNRVSLRKYSEKTISKEHEDSIIHAAMRAPTAGNMMLYSIIIVRDAEKKQKLSETCDNQPFIAKAPLVMLFLADMQRFYDYFEYCKVKDFCTEKGVDYKEPGYANLFLAASDALIAAQNAVISAESLGIGSCYIGDIMENYEIHREMFNLPDKVFPIGMLCFGYYPENYKRTISPRYSREYVVFDDCYRHLSDGDFGDMFKEISKKVTPGNVYGAENFGQLIYSRKFGSDFFIEMERSVKEALKRWNSKL